MATNKRHKVKGYAGIYYRLVNRTGSTNQSKVELEKMFYVTLSRKNENGEHQTYEVCVGGQYKNMMTPAKANLLRGQYIEGRLKLPHEKRAAKEEARKQELSRIDNLFKEYCTGREQNGNLRRDINRYNKHVKPYFADKKPEEIAPLDVERVRKMMQHKKYAPATIKQVLTLLQIICNFGFNMGICKPLSFKIKMPKVDNILDDSLTPDEVGRLLEVIEQDGHLHAGNLLKLALFTGMRAGELFKLKWSDLDFEKGFINIRSPKGGKSQIIPMNKQARAVLESHLKILGADNVFPNPHGEQRQTIARGVNAIFKKAGLQGKRPLHSLRHTFASMAISSGEIDLYTLQKLTTHKSPQMLQRYAHLADERVKQGSEAAGRAIDKAVKLADENQQEPAVNIFNLR
ncbi:MAG: site-specific integrase [Desulfamplus sp.]|nr:site-specific integrase [Desulfamplus sp.]